MFGDLQRTYHWVLPTHRYKCQEQLIADLDLCVIQPAEKKAEKLRKPSPHNLLLRYAAAP
jgi:hypothetical protein